MKRQSKAPAPVTVGDLKPAPYNPRVIDDAALAVLGQSMKDLGDCSGIVVNVRSGNTIVGGHQRAKHLDPAWPITRQPFEDQTGTVALGHVETPFGRWAVRFVDWPAEKERRANLAANQIGGEWDTTVLEAMLREMPDADRMLAGFDLGAMKELGIDMGGEEEPADAEPQTGRAKELQRRWRTKPGQLWALGDHRLAVGDCTDEATVTRLMDGQRAGLINTDPPYGVGYANDDRPNPGVAKPRVAKPRVANDKLQDEALQAFLEKCFGLAVKIALKPDAAWYMWHGLLMQGYFAAAAAAADVVLHRQIIWVKPVLLLGRGQYHWKHETAFMGWVRGNQPPDYGLGNGERTQTTVWELGGVTSAERKEFGHSTPKPVGLFTIPIVKHLRRGEIAYEPFAGSGPQFIAAQNAGMRCYGCELEPGFCAVILQRFTDAFSIKPRLL